MTKYKKILSVIAVIFVLSAAFTVTALANAEAADDGAISCVEGPTYVAPEARDGTSGDEISNNTDSVESAEDVGTSPDGEAANPMAEMFSVIKSHMAEILSALTLVGSLILAIAFKRGLIPLMRGALRGLGDSADAAKASAEDAARETELIKSAIDERTAAIEKSTAAVSDAVRALGEEIKELKGQGLDKRLLYSTLGAEVELLYDIFMSSSLPSFQKEAVSQRLAKMREELAEGDEK